MTLDLLHAELDQWAAEDKVAPIWWRDDDAVADTPQLQQLLALAERYAIPMTLAVIPEPVEQSLADRLADNPLMTVAQHGWGHHNNGAPDAKTIELGGLVDRQALRRDLATGRERLQHLFDQPVAMMVPPWNRIERDVLAMLPELGFSVVSSFNRRPAMSLFPTGLARCNTHADPIAWRDGRDFAGEEATLEPLVSHLRWLRTEADSDERAGMMTHHLVHTDRVWQFTEKFAGLVSSHPGARWVIGSA